MGGESGPGRGHSLHEGPEAGEPGCARSTEARGREGRLGAPARGGALPAEICTPTWSRSPARRPGGAPSLQRWQ